MTEQNKKRKLPPVDRHVESKKLKLYTGQSPRGRQSVLPFLLQTKDTAAITLAVAKEVFEFEPDPLYWYKHLPSTPKEIKQQNEEFRALNGGKPCPELPKEIWLEIVKKVILIAYWYDNWHNWICPSDFVAELRLTNRVFHGALKPYLFFCSGSVKGALYVRWDLVETTLVTNK